MNTILLATLCIVIGLFIGYVMVDKVRGKEKIKPVAKKVVNKPKTKKRHMEFSKKILYVTFIVAVIIIIYTMIIFYMMVTIGYMGDSSTLNTLIMGLFTEISVGTGFYYWKARKENIIKLEMKYGTQVNEEE